MKPSVRINFREKVYATILVVCSTFFIPVVASAQYTELGFGVGLSTYWGDLNAPSISTNLTKNSGLALQFHGRKIFKNNIGVKLAFMYGQVKGDDTNSPLDWQEMRNLSFKSSISELSLMGEYYIFGFDTEPGSTIFLPYIAGGISGFRFDPKTVYRGSLVRLQPLGTEGQGLPSFDQKYSLYSGALCFGGGAKILLTESINIGLEVVMRRTFTDYLDDVSKSYVNYDDLSAGNGVLAANLANRTNEFLGIDEPLQLPTGSQRGGQTIKDYFISTFVTINIKLDSGNGRSKYSRGNKVICPKF